MELLKMTAIQAANAVKEKQISVKELTGATLDQIAKTNTEINAFITINENALAQAEAIDQKIANGESLSPLAGVPYAIGDNICTKGIKTTCGSKIMGDFAPPYDAFVSQKLADAGGVMLGKLNMDEFGLDGAGQESYYGAVKNPRNTDYVAGGSASGSAAAIAAEQAFYTLGSDTGGGLRKPAAFCGVSALKPTYGSVSRYGLAACAASMDQIGPMGKTAADLAQIMNAIAGYNAMDGTSHNRPTVDYTAALEGGIKGMRIALPTQYFDACDNDVKDCVMDAIKIMENAGAQVSEVSLPLTQYAVVAHFILSSAEAGSNLSRYDGVKYGFRAEQYDDLMDMYAKTRAQGLGDMVQFQSLIGTHLSSKAQRDVYNTKAMQVRTMVIGEIKEIFGSFDIIASPTALTTAVKLGEKADDVSLCKSNLCTIAANLTGGAAISIPCGVGQNGMPVGLHLMGDAFSDGTLLRAARTFQSITNFHKA